MENGERQKPIPIPIPIPNPNLTPQQHQQQQQTEEHNGMPPQQQPQQHQQQQQNHLTLGLPHAHSNPPQAPAPATAGNIRDDCWSEGATNTLIDAWGQRYLHLNRGNLKQKHWREVSDAVNARPGASGKSRKTDIQCKNRLDTLKKKYKTEKGRLINGQSRWPFYAKLDALIGPPRKNQITQKLTPQHHLHVGVSQSFPAPSQPMPLPSKNQVPNGSRSSGSGSPDTTESCPKRARVYENSDSPLKELASAILKFGEVYERIEMAKQQQLVELEKQRLEFTRDIELQRMQLFFQTQLEVAKIESAKHGGTEHFL
eukprot:TRINITY_DN25998_c0_g1_i1.p1 TRINITY_DN25998_c0_g1~~TRINITY_DN25998_c0_g1_i1.p1  ORF type:complete len:314 (-),score=48.93 TRINITY_DN25998_c0_g1_i1:656-1597(-)